MTTTPSFEDWKLEQEVTVSLSVAVNGELVYDSSWGSLDSMEEDLRKPESAIEEKLRDEYNYTFKLEEYAEDEE